MIVKERNDSKYPVNLEKRELAEQIYELEHKLCKGFAKRDCECECGYDLPDSLDIISYVMPRPSSDGYLGICLRCGCRID